jgi:hypothetical protein
MSNDRRDAATPPWPMGAGPEQDSTAIDAPLGWWLSGGASLLAWTGLFLLLTST